jgi:hypothetical protein
MAMDLMVIRENRKVSDAFKTNMPIVFEPVLPKWNCWVMPQ